MNNTYFSYGGIVGLSYPNGQWDKKFSSYLLPTLKEKKIITKYIFSIEMNIQTMKVVVGGYEDATILRVANSSRSNVSSLINWSALTTTAWSYPFNTINLGNTNIEIYNGSALAMIDLGYKYVQMPSSILKKFIDSIENQGRNCEFVGNLYECVCTGLHDSVFPPLIFSSIESGSNDNNFNLTISPQIYLLPKDNNEYCQILLEPDFNLIPEWIFGQVFL